MCIFEFRISRLGNLALIRCIRMLTDLSERDNNTNTTGVRHPEVILSDYVYVAWHLFTVEL